MRARGSTTARTLRGLRCTPYLASLLPCCATAALLHPDWRCCCLTPCCPAPPRVMRPAWMGSWRRRRRTITTSQSRAPQCWIGGSHGGQGCAGRRGPPPPRPHSLAHFACTCVLNSRPAASVAGRIADNKRRLEPTMRRLGGRGPRRGAELFQTCLLPGRYAGSAGSAAPAH